MEIHTQYLKPHLHSGPVLRDYDNGIFQQAILNSSASLVVHLSNNCTIPFVCQVLQKTAFPFAQIHAF